MGTHFNELQGLGGARRDRTADLLHAMQALSQLSYSPDRERGEILSVHFAPDNADMPFGIALLSERQREAKRLPLVCGGVDGTRTRDPRRDRPVF